MTITINGTGTVTGANTLTNTNTVTSAAATALTLQSAGTTAVTIDTSQNVGIGTSSPNQKLQVVGTNSTGFVGATLQNSNANVGLAGVQFSSDPTYSKAAIAQVRENANGSGPLVFYVNSNANAANWSASDEKMRIDSSGNLLVGTTSQIGIGLLNVKRTTANNTASFQNGSDAGFGIAFYNVAGSVAGSISWTATTTTYTTSSDYRLKNTIAPMTGALDKVALLKPVTYKWKVDGTDGEGFIAHELAEVCPNAVTGAKDAVNEDGSIKPQGIDVSFLVATLTAAIQELNTRLTALEGAK